MEEDVRKDLMELFALMDAGKLQEFKMKAN